MKKKSLLSEVRQLQKIAGLLKEDFEEKQTPQSVQDAFVQAGINLEAPCTTVDDELTVKKFKRAGAVLAQLEKRAAGQTAQTPTYMFPKDIADPAELMGTPDEDFKATEGLNFKLIVDILDGGFVEIWQ